MILEKKGNELIELTDKKSPFIIDDTIVSPDTVFSSKKLDELSKVSIIDDSTVSPETCFSSSKIDTLASEAGMPIVEVTSNTNNFQSPSDKAVCLYFKTTVNNISNLSINGSRIRYRLGVDENWLYTSLQSGTVLKCIKVGSYWICDGQTVTWRYSNYLWRTASGWLVVRPYYKYITYEYTSSGYGFLFPDSEIRSAFDSPSVIKVNVFFPYFFDGRDESEFGKEKLAAGIATYSNGSYSGSLPSANNDNYPVIINGQILNRPSSFNAEKLLIKVLPWGDYYNAL